jgi:hypothetical protein
MPRNDLKAYTSVVARIPQGLADQVKQYASQHRCSVSELIREGLEMRLDAQVPGRSHTSSSDPGGEVFHEVVQTLHTLASMLQAAVHGTVRETVTEVFHEVFPEVVHTGTQEQTSADEVLHEVIQHTTTADAPVSQHGAGFDTTRFFVGEFCPQRHRYQDTAGSLRSLRGDQDCVTCRQERNQRYNEQKREKRRQKATQPQKG